MQTTQSTTDRCREERAPRILARTLFRELRAQGFDRRQLEAFALEFATLARQDDGPRRH